MKKWTHNGTGKDYYEIGDGPFSGVRCRVNDYDFVVAVDTPGKGLAIYPQASFDPTPHRGGTVYYGQMQTDDPVEPGDMLRVYKAAQDGKTWFRPLREWTDDRFTCIADLNRE